MAPTATNPGTDQHGPHPSYIQVAQPFLFEQKIADQILGTGSNLQREDNARLQGVQWIDDVRRALQLPVRTFNTAVIYYHKFRLVHKDNEYQFQDAAAAALFAACKIEDTLKKSREILCTAHNLRGSSSEHLTPDDSLFDGSSKIIIGLERLMLEASGFDYRNRHPQKYLLKLAKKHGFDRDVARVAYRMLLDLYRTFAPLKQTSAAMALACLELTVRLMEQQTDRIPSEATPRFSKLRVNRQQVMETMLDLLDLYTHFQKSSMVGPTFNMDNFIKTRIALNQEAEEQKLPRYAERQEQKAHGHKSAVKTPKTPITPASPSEARTNGRDIMSPATLSPRSAGSGRRGVGSRGQEGTVRFMLDGTQAKHEKSVVAEYFNVEFEEYEIEVEEPVKAETPPSRPKHVYERNGREFMRDDRNGRPFKRGRR